LFHDIWSYYRRVTTEYRPKPKWHGMAMAIASRLQINAEIAYTHG